jgi:hypothetical protein
MKRKLIFGSRPKKTGAKKTYRIKTHKRRLVAAGYEESLLKKLNPRELRDLLKKVAKKKAPSGALQRSAAKARTAAKAKTKAKKAK